MSGLAKERELIVAGARLSIVDSGRDSRANTSVLVKSLVKKYKADGSTLLQAAEWAESILLSNVEWLVKLAKRGDAVDETTPVVVSVGHGHDIMVIWASSPVPTGNLPFPVRRVNVALTLCSDEAAQAMNGTTLVQTYGCIQPNDSLYEHVRCEVDMGSRDTRPTIYFSTEHVPWAGSPSICGTGAGEGEKGRVQVVQTSPHDPYTPVRVETVTNAASFFARIAAEETISRLPANGALVAQVNETSRKDEGHKDAGLVQGTGFLPRELLLLARAYQGEPYSEQERTWDILQTTQHDITQCERLLERRVTLAASQSSTVDQKKSLGTTAQPKKSLKKAVADQSKMSKDIATDAMATPKKRGRPVGSKNKPKEAAQSNDPTSKEATHSTVEVRGAEGAAVVGPVSGTSSTPPRSKGSATIQAGDNHKKAERVIMPQPRSPNTPQVGSLTQIRDQDKSMERETMEAKSPEVPKQPGTLPRSPKKSGETATKKQGSDAKSRINDKVPTKAALDQAGAGGDDGARKRGRPKGSKNRSKEDRKKKKSSSVAVSAS